jgi:hypothetical protein
VTFEEYLESKKINGVAFQQADPERFAEWASEFVQMSPASFTAQKLYFINSIRKKCPLQKIVSAPNKPE